MFKKQPRRCLFALIRDEGFIPRPSGAVIKYETRDQYLMRTTYPAALRRGMLITIPVIIAVALFYVSCQSYRVRQTGPVLEIKDAYSGKVYGRWPLEENGEFSIEFIHSVNQSSVRDFFSAENGMIRLRAVRFFSFGAGMQSDLEEGLSFSRDGDAMVISGYTTTFKDKELNYIVGTVSDHLLFINSETVSLRQLCGKNAHINIRIR